MGGPFHVCGALENSRSQLLQLIYEPFTDRERSAPACIRRDKVEFLEKHAGESRSRQLAATRTASRVLRTAQVGAAVIMVLPSRRRVGNRSRRRSQGSKQYASDTADALEEFRPQRTR